MTKILIPLFSALLLSTTVSAKPASELTDRNSLPKAVLEMAHQENKSYTNKDHATPYTHESEKNNSLVRGALAKQGAQVNFRFNSDSEVSYSRDATKSENNNSLSRGALAK